MFREGAVALVTCAAFRSDIGGESVMKSRAGTLALLAAAGLALIAGCSRERIDWKSAEAADTPEAYDRFIDRYPDSALAMQARARIAQLAEDKDWQVASTADTPDAYRAFLAKHANGKWAQEARIRIENFTLDTNVAPANTAETALPAERGEPATPSPGTASARGSAGSAASPAAREGANSAPARAAQPSSAPRPGAIAQTPQSSSTPTNAPSPAARDAAPQNSARPAAANEPASAGERAATPATESGYGIQLGAFSSQAAALGEWKRLQVKFDPQLHGLFARAIPVKVSSGTLFRLQSPVGDEARARSICAVLSERAQPCVVVLPESQ
jgi:SPOR domain